MDTSTCAVEFPILNPLLCPGQIDRNRRGRLCLLIPREAMFRKLRTTEGRQITIFKHRKIQVPYR